MPALDTADLSLRYAATTGELAEVEPLWNALHAHHAAISPELGSAIRAAMTKKVSGSSSQRSYL